MADNNNFEEIGPKDELIDAIAQLDDEGDRVIELKDEETGETTKAVVESTFLFSILFSIRAASSFKTGTFLLICRLRFVLTNFSHDLVDLVQQ